MYTSLLWPVHTSGIFLTASEKIKTWLIWYFSRSELVHTKSMAFVGEFANVFTLARKKLQFLVPGRKIRASVNTSLVPFSFSSWRRQKIRNGLHLASISLRKPIFCCFGMSPLIRDTAKHLSLLSFLFLCRVSV